jgi:hypothetical protein
LVAEDDPWVERTDFLVEVVVSKYERQKSQTETVNAMPLYPTEAILWDDNQVPKVHYTGHFLHLACSSSPCCLRALLYQALHLAFVLLCQLLLDS